MIIFTSHLLRKQTRMSAEIPAPVPKASVSTLSAPSTARFAVQDLGPSMTDVWVRQPTPHHSTARTAPLPKPLRGFLTAAWKKATVPVLCYKCFLY